MRRPFATVAIAALVAGVAFVSSGCGVQTGVAGSGGADLAHGQQLFISTCGGCHTLAEAGTKGVIGPNLDAAYAQPRSNGFADSSFEALVREQIQRGFPYARPTPMPANLLKGQDAQDVAAYVAAAAATKSTGGSSGATG
ncbi:MAG TPA: c-type cytochrome [Gaiellales bacterium]|nr:c-type cytochrome [Gaiellales bacterium]